MEGSKNPSPLSWAWFGAVRIERKPLRYEQDFRRLLHHTHPRRRPLSYFLNPSPDKEDEQDEEEESTEADAVAVDRSNQPSTPQTPADSRGIGHLHNRRQNCWTHLYFRVYFKLGAKMPRSPSPPGQCCVILCCRRALCTAVQHGFGGRGGGIPEKYFLDYFSLKTVKLSLPVCSVGKVSQLILSPIVVTCISQVQRLWLYTVPFKVPL